MEFLKWTFPLPPLPPFAIRNTSPSCLKSLIMVLEFASLNIVPTGTLIIKSSPFLPNFLFLPPGWPFCALYLLLYLNSSRVDRFLVALIMILPPLPPSPPAGPPVGSYFSLRQATAPFPPSPAFKLIFAKSIIKNSFHMKKTCRKGRLSFS